MKRLIVLISIFAMVSIGYGSFRSNESFDGFIWSLDNGPWYEATELELTGEQYIETMKLNKVKSGYHIIRIKAFKYESGQRLETEMEVLEFNKD